MTDFSRLKISHASMPKVTFGDYQGKPFRNFRFWDFRKDSVGRGIFKSLTMVHYKIFDSLNARSEILKTPLILWEFCSDPLNFSKKIRRPWKCSKWVPGWKITGPLMKGYSSRVRVKESAKFTETSIYGLDHESEGDQGSCNLNLRKWHFAMLHI